MLCISFKGGSCLENMRATEENVGFLTSIIYSFQKERLVGFLLVWQIQYSLALPSAKQIALFCSAFFR